MARWIYQNAPETQLHPFCGPFFKNFEMFFISRGLIQVLQANHCLRKFRSTLKHLRSFLRTNCGSTDLDQSKNGYTLSAIPFSLYVYTLKSLNFFPKTAKLSHFINQCDVLHHLMMWKTRGVDFISVLEQISKQRSDEQQIYSDNMNLYMV